MPADAAAQQPYIVPGSLYLLVVPAHLANDEHYSDVLGRWLDYLQAGAPGAIVQPVLTQCDRFCPPRAPPNGTHPPSSVAPSSGPAAASARAAADYTPEVLQRATAVQVAWVRRAIYWHQVVQPKGAVRLRIQPKVLCVSSVCRRRLTPSGLIRNPDLESHISPPLG